MQIIELEPYAGSAGRESKVLATFSVQVNDDLRLNALKLVDTPNGRRTFFPSMRGGNRLASASVSLARKITDQASRVAYEQGIA
jgi:hypothetical protein